MEKENPNGDIHQKSGDTTYFVAPPINKEEIKQKIAQEQAEQMSRKNESANGSKVIVLTILINLLLLPIGAFLLMADGWCAGGARCTGRPGLESLAGSAMIAAGFLLIVSSYSANSKGKKSKIFIIPVIIFLISYIGKWLLYAYMILTE